MAAADIHLRINGFVLDVDPEEAANFIEELFEQSKMRMDRIEPWIRERVRSF